METLDKEVEPVMVVLDEHLITKVLRGDEALAEQARQDQERQDVLNSDLARSALQEVMA